MVRDERSQPDRRRENTARHLSTGIGVVGWSQSVVLH